MFKHILISILVVVSLHSNEKKINNLPFEYFNVQYAGYLGFLSIGGGNTFYDAKYDLEFYIGVTPRLFNISEITIYTFGVKNNYIPYTFQHNEYIVRPYVGAGLLFAKNKRYDPNWQDTIEFSYYNTLNLHLTINTGININKKFKNSSIKSAGLYVEAVAIDTFLYSYVVNLDTMKLSDIFSLAIGVRIKF